MEVYYTVLIKQTIGFGHANALAFLCYSEHQLATARKIIGIENDCLFINNPGSRPFFVHY